MRYDLVTEADIVTNYFLSLSSYWAACPHKPSDWLARLSVLLPSPVAMLWTCLAASLCLGPTSALIPDPRPEQTDLLSLRNVGPVAFHPN